MLFPIVFISALYKIGTDVENRSADFLFIFSRLMGFREAGHPMYWYRQVIGGSIFKIIGGGGGGARGWGLSGPNT